jgi:hypothetical protein
MAETRDLEPGPVDKAFEGAQQPEISRHYIANGKPVARAST